MDYGVRKTMAFIAGLAITLNILSVDDIGAVNDVSLQAPEMEITTAEPVDYVPSAYIVSNSHISAESEEFTDDIISVNIYSMTGQLLRTCDDAKPNLQGLPAGTYMVVYNSNNNSITQKLVLQ